MREFLAPELGYRFFYDLVNYSVRVGCTCALPNSGASVLFPGVIEVVPNDFLLYGTDAPRVAYRISIAAVDAPEITELDAGLFGAGPLVQYGQADLAGLEAEQIDLNGVPALRLKDVFSGVRPIEVHIIALHDSQFYEILVEAVPGTLDNNDFDDYQSVLDTFHFGPVR
ncbi:MAG: hypothetical protein HC915_18950 [Anaerolineae bacterium]|nr:hypothetical protein [Anaerolineae bacterium]